jgi:peptidoglycan/LPS O-acetylase OafA/YrhL
MSHVINRMPLIDALKAVAALLVLFNHFSSYGPLAATLREAFPGWLNMADGRPGLLVVAGFPPRGLSARGQALTRRRCR